MAKATHDRDSWCNQRQINTTSFMSRPALRGVTLIFLSFSTQNLKNKQLMVPMGYGRVYQFRHFWGEIYLFIFLSLSDSTLYYWLVYFLVSHFHEFNNGL